MRHHANLVEDDPDSSKDKDADEEKIHAATAQVKGLTLLDENYDSWSF